MMKPSPNAAPITPMPRDRSLGAVMSATYAWAAEMLPPANPDTTRARNSRGYECAAANNRYPAALHSIVVSRMGRRPTRSDVRPRTAVATNCIRE